MFTILYNALEGNADQIRQDAKPSQWHLTNWVCFGPEEYETLANLDINKDSYILSTDKINSFLVSKDSTLDFDKLYEGLYSVAEQ